MTAPLAHRTAIVTGSSSGIGRAVAVAMAEAGCSHVTVNCPVEAEREAAESVAAEIRSAGAKALVCVGDVSQEADCRRMVAEAGDFAGRVDILVNNAGIAHGDPVESLSAET